MIRLAGIALVCLLALALTVLVSPWRALGYPTDDNPQNWFGLGIGLQQNWINGGNQIRVCSSDFPSSTTAAMNNWNQALGLNAFVASDCGAGNFDVAVGFLNFELCQSSTAHACTLPTTPYTTGYPDYAIVNPIGVLMNPAGHNGVPWVDGDSHTTRDVTHELGHVFGKGDYFGLQLGGCPLINGQRTPTLMDSDEVCLYYTPQQLDKDNYHIIYHPDAVENLHGSSPSAGQVNLYWNQDPNTSTGYRGVANESSFDVWDNPSSWTYVTTEGKNEESSSFSGQTPGAHTYCVYPRTNADNVSTFGDAACVNINVTAPTMTRVSGFTLNAYTSSKMKLTWTAVTGADHYEYCVMANPTQNPTGSTYCADISDTSVTTTAPFPSSGSEAVYYFAARAVDASGNEGPLSNRGAISGLNETTGGVKYKSYHTLYKTGSSANKINAFNKNSSSRYLAFTNTSTTKKKSVSSGTIMYSPGPYAWSASDWQTGYGPLLVAQESTSSTMSPREEVGISTLCMYSMTYQSGSSTYTCP